VTLAVRNLVHYRRLHAAVALGAAVATGVIIGALGAGDSVRHSLGQLARARTGKAMSALVSAERFVTVDLASRLASAAVPSAAPVLLLHGSAVAHGGSARVNDARIIGVDSRFWLLSEAGSCPVARLEAEQTLISAPLARRLGIGPGDTLSVRVDSPGPLPRELAFAAGSREQTSLRLTVAGIADELHYGGFGLGPGQVQPCNVFVDRAWLGRATTLSGKANVILSATPVAPRDLDAAWRLEDAGLSLRPVSNAAQVELTASRVFMDAETTNAAFAAGFHPRGVFSYFVNGLRAGTHAAPYSFVSSDSSDRSDESDRCTISSWLARDLRARPGDQLELHYYVAGPLRRLVETTAVLRISAIAECGSASTPEFPGLTDTGNCRDWKPGIPIDLARIRPQDETYWNQYRAKPKVRVPLATAQRLWANQYGALTAVRFMARETDVPVLSSNILSLLGPATCGLEILPIRAQALAACGAPVDFGQLFAGLSSFLVVAAVLLTSLLFVFIIEQRAAQAGILRTIGFTPRAVWRLQLAEGAVVAATGGIAGMLLGLGYNRLIIAGVRTVWRGAVGAADLSGHVKLDTILIGFAAGLVASVAGMWLALRSQAHLAVCELIRGGATDAAAAQPATSFSSLMAVTGALGALLLAVLGAHWQSATACLAAGALLLAAGITGCHTLLRSALRLPGMDSLAWRMCRRRPGRSSATIALIACGVFMVVVVAANRQGGCTEGTGGFALYGETTLPLAADLSDPPVARRILGLGSNGVQGVTFVQLRVRDGDDASCRSLTRAQRPRLIGVPAGVLARFGASFGPVADGTIPAVADQSVIQWGLGKRVGDVLDYTDDSGRPFAAKLTASIPDSILQGSVLIPDTVFSERFPASGGSRVLLVDAPANSAAEVARSLSVALRDAGLEITPASTRLADFTAVRNTYLSIFLALGGLGLVLGTAGLGVVVMRTVLDRRRELAVMNALGFSRIALERLLFLEHAVLLVLGMCAGCTSALVAVLPRLIAADAAVPWAWLALLGSAILANACTWIWLAARMALHGTLATALRDG